MGTECEEHLSSKLQDRWKEHVHCTITVGAGKEGRTLIGVDCLSRTVDGSISRSTGPASAENRRWRSSVQISAMRETRNWRYGAWWFWFIPLWNAGGGMEPERKHHIYIGHREWAGWCGMGQPNLTRDAIFSFAIDHRENFTVFS